ncbi:hypothetical protein [Methylocystis parvus]|uniref:Uncharacterized protein n=1 Tax=Methylocystis parvus TaxID=134 RepID=A0A6B8M4G8_9HYPH|nr:hypothetical protein [Methylocystis parvus]QGM98824.1 hypothetical protein F7D14_15920 [Methylocystis parvus]WBK00826.1 hypothetical protein MMG94_03635 [Methylocystis parvus OBBP]
MSIECSVFALAFGEPRPFNAFILNSWKACPIINFNLITDQPDLWKAACGDNSENISIIKMTLEEYFSLFLSNFSVENNEQLLSSYGDMLKGLNGWTACCMRPFLREAFQARVTSRFWGWIDYDVILNPSAIIEHVHNNKDRDLLMFPKGALWEQFKLFRCAVPIEDVARAIIKDRSYNGGPLDAVFVYRLPHLFHDDAIDQSNFIAHWHYTDSRDGFTENKVDAIVDNHWDIRNSVDGRAMMFLADTELKLYDDNMVNSAVKSIVTSGQFTFEYSAAEWVNGQIKLR